jgi:hypothetical protein
MIPIRNSILCMDGSMRSMQNRRYGLELSGSQRRFLRFAAADGRRGALVALEGKLSLSEPRFLPETGVSKQRTEPSEAYSQVQF